MPSHGGFKNRDGPGTHYFFRALKWAPELNLVVAIPVSPANSISSNPVFSST